MSKYWLNFFRTRGRKPRSVVTESAGAETAIAVPSVPEPMAPIPPAEAMSDAVEPVCELELAKPLSLLLQPYFKLTEAYQRVLFRQFLLDARQAVDNFDYQAKVIVCLLYQAQHYNNAQTLIDDLHGLDLKDDAAKVKRNYILEVHGYVRDLLTDGVHSAFQSIGGLMPVDMTFLFYCYLLLVSDEKRQGIFASHAELNRKTIADWQTVETMLFIDGLSSTLTWRDGVSLTDRRHQLMDQMSPEKHNKPNNAVSSAPDNDQAGPSEPVETPPPAASPQSKRKGVRVCWCSIWSHRAKQPPQPTENAYPKIRVKPFLTIKRGK